MEQCDEAQHCSPVGGGIFTLGHDYTQWFVLVYSKYHYPG